MGTVLVVVDNLIKNHENRPGPVIKSFFCGKDAHHLLYVDDSILFPTIYDLNTRYSS
jgi:hypothetical protein